MSNSVLIIGPSGSGKSSSIRKLDPSETFIISVLDKPLPFRGYKKIYKPIKGWSDTEGNYYCSDNWAKVLKCIRMVSDSRPEITTLVIDDAHFIMANEFMMRATEKGFERFSEIAQHMWLVMNGLASTRGDLTCFVLSHSEIDNLGVSKPKTVGKMLDDKITLEAMVTVVFHTMIQDGEYKFLTQHNNTHISKSPVGMFEETLIDNDLQEVKQRIESYYNDEE
jgi:hypothetical protein